MNSPRLTLILSAALLGSIFPALSAAEILKLDSVLYVFKDTAFAHILIDETPAPTSRAIAFNAPVTLTFDQEAVVLGGATYAWDGGQNVPPRFSQLELPRMITAPGQPASVRCVQPTQYLEKAADGSLHVREIPRESPEAPHYQVKLTVQAAGAATTELLISCEMDLAMIKGREKIPGVDLDTGRPILASFKDTLQFRSPPGTWSGVLVRSPGGSDYSVLLLLKVMPEGGVPPPVAPRAQGPTTAKSDPARIEVSGYSVIAPSGGHWRRKENADGAIFENRIDDVIFYRAGFSVVRASAFPDRESFLNFVKQTVKASSDTSGYGSVRDSFEANEKNGLWVVECSLNRDDWKAVYENAHDTAVTRIKTLYAMDPHDSGRIVSVWFAWRGVTFDEARFNAEAAAFLGSLQKAHH